MLRAKKVYYDFKVYQHFLRENDIEDDSEHVSVDDMNKYIKNEIPEEDYKRLLQFCLESY